MKPFCQDLQGNPRLRFCALAYNPSHGAEGLSPADRAILLLLEQPTRLLVLVDPGWQSRIPLFDHGFFEETIADLAHRAKSDPLGLLNQASELNLGPLVTQETGLVGTNREGIAEFVQRFVPA